MLWKIRAREGRRVYRYEYDQHEREDANDAEQLKVFPAGTVKIEFQGCGQDVRRYRRGEGALRRFGYSQPKRLRKGLMMRYVARGTEYSPQQLARLVKRALAKGNLIEA